MRLTVIIVQPAPALDPKPRPLLAWCNERAGLATMLMLVLTMLTLGFMVWQQFHETNSRLACPPGTKVCNVNTITNNFYEPGRTQERARAGLEAERVRGRTGDEGLACTVA